MQHDMTTRSLQGFPPAPVLLKMIIDQQV